MCLKPIKIRNPAKAFALEGGQPLQLEVACGNCAECKKNKRLEWDFRTFYHASECINKGGYVYYDTLTYAPEHLPMFSHFYPIDGTDIVDFSCFNNSHWRNFLKNLRSYLSYHYPTVKFTYFITSEYGTDDLYTHRPHYHPLFFVDSLSLSPYVFSELVSKFWIYGRTDGLPYKTRTYVDEHIFYARSSDSSPCDYLRVCSYVSKYITKDSTFQKTIEARKTLVSKYVTDPEELKKLFRNIDMFHRQSQGFGLNYISNMDKDEYAFIMKHGACRKKDSEKVISTIVLPLYYKRKLFYKCVKRLDKSICWQLNDAGKQYTFNRVHDVVDKVAQRYDNIFRYMKDTDRKYIISLLGTRTFTDFVVYKLYYQGRMRYYFNNNLHLHSVESDLYSWIDNTISSSLKNDYVDISITRDVDNDTCTIPLGFGDIFTNSYESYTLNFTNFIKNAKFNQYSVPEFAHFDEIDELFKLVELPSIVQKQKTFDFIEDLTKKFKVLYERN